MISFNEHDLDIIIFSDLFYNIQFNIINEFSSFYSKSNYNELNSDCKRIILHFLIKDICDTFNKIDSRNKILVIDKSFIGFDYEIWSYLDKDKVSKFIINSFKALTNKLPFPIYVLEDDIKFSEDTGELEDVLHILSNIVEQFSINQRNSRQLKGFSCNKGLNNLTESYFTSGEFKKLLYK